MGGVQRVYRFDNGMGASVETQNGKFPFAFSITATVRKPNHGDKFELDYTTEITDDVIGYLAEFEVDVLLERIADLSSTSSPEKRPDT